MAKGTESKALITEKILSAFEGSFIAGKEIRIPCYENGELVQIKVALTAAKDNIYPTQGSLRSPQQESKATEQEKKEIPFNIEPSQDEISTLKVYMEKLGLN